MKFRIPASSVFSPATIHFSRPDRISPHIQPSASVVFAMATATVSPLLARTPAALASRSASSPRSGLRAAPFRPHQRDLSRRLVQSRGATRCAVADVARTEDEQSKGQLDGDLPQGDQSAQLTADLAGNGWRSTRRTKLVCTIGPACSGFEQIAALAEGGMNVARINMCHGTHQWHRQVIADIRRLNAERGYSVAVMMDTEGSEIHMSDLRGAPSAKIQEGDVWTFTVRQFPEAVALPPHTVQVNYDGFVDDVREGDEVVVDGGMARLQVTARMGPDVVCSVVDPGLLLPRANLTLFRKGQLVRATNSMLPTISSKDWIDIDFGITEGVDFIAISFVRSPEVITHLRSYVNARSPTRPIALIAKIESCDAVGRLEEIIAASDGAMVARGDLGAQIPLEEVPGVQQEMVDICRDLNKPVIVASHLLESMIEFPIPTRAEVADVAEAVHQQADALMLSGESAMGQFPLKALDVLRTVALRFEAIEEGQGAYEGGAGAAVREGRAAVERVAQLPELSEALRDRMSEQICAAAAQMAMRLGAKAIIAFTQRGYMASLLSRCRPNCPIFAVTPSQAVRQHMSVYWGLVPFRLDLSEDAEDNMRRAFNVLKARELVAPGDLIIAVSDVAGGKEAVGARQSVQVRKVL
ncbi:hypothetical protein CLOM_g17777 [Closterium sp. NIES-68]|nr:hypothetical protein CLOM_g17777 [Closterium sp. NIES-68]GJP61545.1 hypothetical protein CLOP_g18691 [Closterium sp. NIES-67]